MCEIFGLRKQEKRAAEAGEGQVGYDFVEEDLKQ